MAGVGDGGVNVLGPALDEEVEGSMSERQRKEPVRRKGVLAALAGCGEEKDMVRLRGGIGMGTELSVDIEERRAGEDMG